MNHQFELPGSYKKWTYGLLAAGIVAVLYGMIAYHPFEHVVHGAAGEGAHSVQYCHNTGGQ